MTKSKSAQATENIANQVVGAYQTTEDAVTGTYNKIENGVTGTYTKKDCNNLNKRFIEFYHDLLYNASVAYCVVVASSVTYAQPFKI